MDRAEWEKRKAEADELRRQAEQRIEGLQKESQGRETEFKKQIEKEIEERTFGSAACSPRLTASAAVPKSWKQLLRAPARTSKPPVSGTWPFKPIKAASTSSSARRSRPCPRPCERRGMRCGPSGRTPPPSAPATKRRSATAPARAGADRRAGGSPEAGGRSLSLPRGWQRPTRRERERHAATAEAARQAEQKLRQDAEALAAELDTQQSALVEAERQAVEERRKHASFESEARQREAALQEQIDRLTSDLNGRTARLRRQAGHRVRKESPPGRTRRRCAACPGSERPHCGTDTDITGLSEQLDGTRKKLQEERESRRAQIEESTRKQQELLGGWTSAISSSAQPLRRETAPQPNSKHSAKSTCC